MIKAMRTVASEPDGTARIMFLDERGQEVAAGTVDTDLAAGSYKLRADMAGRRWVIVAPAVPAGLRFNVELNGKNPWSLAYASVIDLQVASERTMGDLTVGAVDIGSASPSTHPNYIEQVVKSVSIPIWGGPFSLNREKLGYLTLARQDCWLDQDPVAGQLELTTVYMTRDFALAALSRLGRGGYTYYLGAGGHIWPTRLSTTTAPWLCESLRKAIEVERADARAAENLGWDLLLWYVGARFPVKAGTGPSKPPSMESAGASAAAAKLAGAGKPAMVFVEIGAGDLKASLDIARRAKGTIQVIAVDPVAPSASAVAELEALGGKFVKGTAEAVEAGSAHHVFQYFPWRIGGSGQMVTGGTWRLITDTLRLLKPQGAAHFVTEDLATAEFLAKQASAKGMRAVITDGAAGVVAPGASGAAVPDFAANLKVWLVNVYK